MRAWRRFAEMPVSDTPVEQPYKGWTVEKRLWAIHWLVAAVWITDIVGILSVGALAFLLAMAG